ncbi:SDR family oxidoreductase [Pseudoramibacter faecis]|uniref:SDR family NAD(P)-dependent oxidoreductase n=1 Tax=Pseudoramibacter faecis TaxID=3108534 RepID=UPI002E768D55|nr:SDR family oxidoreductase [Pseudoramibacter sp. HA2172]
MDKKIAVVTGGSEGIGQAIAKRFAEAGYAVVIASRREKVGRETEAELQKRTDAMWMQCDVSSDEDCRAVALAAKKKYGRIDVLVNDAGVVGKREDFFELDVKDIRKTMDINVMGTIQMMKHCAAVMKEQKKGVIVNIGSICGILVNTESIAYHASKGAIRMVTQRAAYELAQYGIRVLSVAPGWVATQMALSVMKADPVAEKHGKSLHMSNRILTPEQIAGTVYLLSQDEASAVNGSTIMADDGYASFKI